MVKQPRKTTKKRHNAEYANQRQKHYDVQAFKYPIAIVAVRNPMVLSSTSDGKNTKLFNNAMENKENT